MTVLPYINHEPAWRILPSSNRTTIPTSDRKMCREDTRPTLPPVRDLFRDELSRSARPPTNLSPPWIVPGPRADHNLDRSFTRAERRQDSQLDGPGVQRSAPSAAYYSHPTQQRYDGRTGSRAPPPGSLSPSISQYHPPVHPQYHARSTSQADQRPGPHDQCTPPGSHPYSNLPAPAYYSYPTTGLSSRGSGSYSEGYARDQDREGMTAPVASEARQPPASTVSSLKYECDYCGKGFTRPSSLKIHLNSHTGEKPFVCTFEGCGRSFSVLSNMRRHARVHNEAPSRHQESSDEHSDRQ
ncbi:hypothetical protein V8E55_004477 [Tylopilus felleus]